MNKIWNVQSLKYAVHEELKVNKLNKLSHTPRKHNFDQNGIRIQSKEENIPEHTDAATAENGSIHTSHHV